MPFCISDTDKFFKNSQEILLRTTAIPVLTSALAALTFGVAAFPGTAHADDWLGTTSTDWFNAANWSAGVPDAATDAIIDTTTPNATEVDGAAAGAAITVVGNTGTGSLTISNGGTLASDDAHLGVIAGGTGTAVVTGPASIWSSAALYVGNGGNGTLTVSDDGFVAVADGAIIGTDTDSNGTVTVTSGATLSNAGELFVGVRGTGALTLSNGGEAVNTAGSLGRDASGAGVVTVTDAGSTWTSTDIIVGDQGAGELMILNGGEVFSQDTLIGAASSGTGAATVSGAGSLWSNSMDLTVGDAGSGALTISEGGTVTATDETRIGFDPDSTGTVAVTGAGSLLNTNTLLVGYLGTGTLSVLDDAEVSASTTTIGNGTATVDGAALNSSIINVGGTGTGALAVSADGIVTADTTFVADGEVTVSGAGALLTSTNIALGTDSDGVLTISDGGTVTSDSLDLGLVGAGTVNIGAGAGETAAAAGTLNAFAMSFSDGTLVFNHTDPGTVFAAEMSGAGGTISHLAGVTTLSGNSVGFDGATTISGGSLYVTGALGGTVDVTGGLLGGTGNLLGNVTVASGGNFAPGNSIGTINASSVTFEAGSVYAVEVDGGGNSDLLNASGTVTLNGGTVQVTASPDYLFGAPYTLITAAGGVVDTFDEATAGVFITPTLSYDANNVYLELALAALDTAALTVNQKAVAVELESIGAGNAIYDAIVMLDTAAQAQAAFDAVSGEIHGSAQTALIEDSRFVRDAANNRIRAAFGSVGADGDATASRGLWAQSFGALGRTDSDGNAGALDRAVGGLFVGVNGAVADDVNLGVLAGYSHSTFDGRSSSGEADSVHVAAYGGTQWGALAFRAGAAYSWHALSFDRTVAFTGFSDGLSSSYDAATGQVFGEVGYGVTMGAARLEPFAKLAHVRHTTDGFSETGGAAALTGTGETFSTTFATLGLRGDTEIALGNTPARATGLIGWQHAFGPTTPSQTHALAGGNAFTVYGAPVARDALLLEAGLDFDIRANTTLGVAYSGQLGTGMYDHALRADLGITF